MKTDSWRGWALALAAGAMALSGCVTSTGATWYAYDEPYATSTYVSIDQFGPALSPYGEWVYVPGLGQAWRPYSSIVGSDFEPYATGGQWVYTNAGWVFESQYPFGWATFHYGRWAVIGGLGWVWSPGSVWAPAWVDWRYGGGYVGWAPLAPVGFHAHYAPRWTYVHTRHFGDPYVYRHRVPPSHYHEATRVTRRAPHPAGAPTAGPPPSSVPTAARRASPTPPPGRSAAVGVPPSPRGAQPPSGTPPAARSMPRGAPPPGARSYPSAPPPTVRSTPPAQRYAPPPSVRSAPAPMPRMTPPPSPHAAPPPAHATPPAGRHGAPAASRSSPSSSGRHGTAAAIRSAPPAAIRHGTPPVHHAAPPHR